MNENSEEPGDLDSAMADKSAPRKPEQHPDDVEENPDNVKDGSAQDGNQPLAGA
jgi:hypothetical protein